MTGISSFKYRNETFGVRIAYRELKQLLSLCCGEAPHLFTSSPLHILWPLLELRKWGAPSSSRMVSRTTRQHWLQKRSLLPDWYSARKSTRKSRASFTCRARPSRWLRIWKIEVMTYPQERAKQPPPSLRKRPKMLPTSLKKLWF